MAMVGAAMLVFFATKGSDLLLARLARSPQAVQPTPAVVAPRMPTAEELSRERERAEQARIDEERTLRLKKAQEVAENQAREAAALREAEARKEEAWQQFYKPSKKCENPPDNAAMVACGNQFIREKQRFEDLYSAGKL